MPASASTTVTAKPVPSLDIDGINVLPRLPDYVEHFANLDDPVNSKLVLEPLQGESSVAGTHTGGDIFPDTGDACYQAIVEWMSVRVDDSAGTSCGFCAPVDVSSCGY